MPKAGAQDAGTSSTIPSAKKRPSAAALAPSMAHSDSAPFLGQATGVPAAPAAREKTYEEKKVDALKNAYEELKKADRTRPLRDMRQKRRRRRRQPSLRQQRRRRQPRRQVLKTRMSPSAGLRLAMVVIF